MRSLTFRHRRLLGLILLVLASAGALALLTIGRQEDPTITNIYATVTTRVPGADPARVEALVTVPIEEALREIPEVDLIESASLADVSVVSLQLDERLGDAAIEQAWSELRDALGDVGPRLPPDALSPAFSNDAGAHSAIVALTPAREGVSLAIVARQAEALADRLREVPGTRKVDLVGAPEEEVLVALDAEALGALGLGVDDVARAIERADSKVQAGRLRGEGSDLVIAVEGEITALSRLREVILREGAHGAAAQLGDLARITRGPRGPPEEAAGVDGARAVLVALRIEEGRQVDAWMAGVRRVLDDAAPRLTGDVAMEVVFDQGRYTVERLIAVGSNMLLGMGIVVAVLLLTMGLRAALIVALVLPLVTLATLATLNALGLAIHQMSLTGLIVALGLLVDAAIVMTHEIGLRLRRGMSRIGAVEDAVGRLFAPLLASTVTTALAFAPMVLLPGPPGDFVGSIAVAVVSMLVWSLVIALLVTPALAGWFLPQGEGRAPRRGWGAPLGRLGGWSVRASLAHPVRAIALALVLPVLGFLGLPTLTAQFFPGTDRDQLHIELEMPPGTALPRTMAVVERLSEALRGRAEVARVVWVAGRSAPSIYYNMITSRRAAPDFGHLLVTTRSPEATEALIPALEADLARSVPEARVAVRGLVQGPPVSAPVELRIVGPELATLRALGEEARGLMEAVPVVTTVRASIEGAAPQVTLAVDEAAARRLGLGLRDVSRQIQAALEGATGGSLVEGTQDMPVRVRLGESWRSDLTAIGDLPLVVPRGSGADGPPAAVPLSAIADLRVVPQPANITRRNGERANTVQAFVAHGVLPQEALSAVRAQLDAAGFAVPPGYRLDLGGDADARAETLANLLGSVPLIVVLSLATVVLTLNSVRLTAVTVVVAVLAAGLSLLSLAVFRFPLGISAIVGVIGSIGVSINAAIIILSALQEDERAASGDRDAMAAVIGDASPHILSTTITTFGGFLPLILAGGGFWPPFAMAIAGGVLLSTVVSIYFVPPMFALVARRAPRPVAAETRAPGVPAPDPEREPAPPLLLMSVARVR